jgi:hypothetical protein
MKAGKQILTLMLGIIIILGCSACGANEVDIGTAPIESAVDNKDLEQSVATEETVQTTDETAQESITSEEEPIYTALQDGDFSYFAGTYERCAVYDDYYGGGEQLPNLILHDNGIITGGLVFGSYPEMKPISVTLNEDGSYLCQVRYESNANQDYFIIYPQGVIGENPYIYNDPFLTETPYIHYFSFDGGAMDIIYYEIED